MTDMLYRIFYVLFAVELVTIAMFPFMIAVRLIMKGLPKQFTVWMWRLYFLRMACPVAISSFLCIDASMLRQYHRLLRNVGIVINIDSGLLRSWSIVFGNDISTSIAYCVCAWIWVLGVVFLNFGIVFYNITYKLKYRIGAKKVKGRVYRTKIGAPAMVGLLHPIYYITEKTDEKDVDIIIKHFKIHRRHFSGFWRMFEFFVVAIHWFNPLVWMAYKLCRMDEESCIDEWTIRGMTEKERLKYAQVILNMPDESQDISFGVGDIFESNSEKRAKNVLYAKRYNSRKNATGVLILTAFVFVAFMLRPVQLLRNGGTWDGRINTDFFAKASSSSAIGGQDGVKKKKLSARTVTVSPSGLSRILELSYKKGAYVLSVMDSKDIVLNSINLTEAFAGAGIAVEKIKFPKKAEIHTGDYNNDSIQEIMIGQNTEWRQNPGESGELMPYVYLMFEITEQGIDIISDPIYALAGKDSQLVRPGVEDGVKDVIYVQGETGKNYYVWDNDSHKYVFTEMTDEMLNQHRNASQSQKTEGVTDTHELKDSSGDVKVSVYTKTDTTGSEEIQEVQVCGQTMPAVKGYFCDLVKTNDVGGNSENYATLIYNGTKSQTFVLYDIAGKREIYRHEDGSENLSKIFKGYDGDHITFKDGGVVLYSLSEYNNGILGISFAADADNNIEIKGSYKYNLKDGASTDLTYSQVTDAT